jgi:hypothetical protein
VGFKLNERHELLVNADDVNLLEDNIYTIKTKVATVIYANKEFFF